MRVGGFGFAGLGYTAPLRQFERTIGFNNRIPFKGTIGFRNRIPFNGGGGGGGKFHHGDLSEDKEVHGVGTTTMIRLRWQ